MENINLNQNYAECIKSIDNIGSTTYVNICTGEQNAVQWGVFNWFFGIFVIVICIAIINLLWKLMKLTVVDDF